jgi:hypothetical protein
MAEKIVSTMSKPQILDQDTCEVKAILAEAEQAFVLCRFDEAMSLTTDILVKASIHFSDNGCSSDVQLQTRMCRQTWNVSFTRDVDAVDRTAALFLQAYYELRPSMKRLDPFMEYYKEKRSIPLEIAILLVQFCFAIQLDTDSVHMAAELCYHVHGKHWIDPELVQDLAWLVMVKMLPYSTDRNYTTVVLDSILSDSNEWSPPLSVYSYQKEINQGSLKCVLSKLDGMYSRYCFSTKYQSELRQHLSLHQVVPDAKLELVNETRDLATQNHSSSTDRPQRWANSVLQLVRQQLLGDSSSCKMAMAIISIYLGWKQRRRLLKAGEIVTSVALSPLKEIIDAFLPDRRGAPNW